MKKPPFECLFCRNVLVPFTAAEHPIPESLGNDDTFLEPGFVCDRCNQYFGSKIEGIVLSSPPFNVERTAYGIPTKKGRLPRYEDAGFSLHPGGSPNRLLVVGYGDLQAANDLLSRGVVLLTSRCGYGDLLARLLLKMGLELLALSEDVDPYASAFDRARRCSRYGDGIRNWDVASGVYPDRSQLKTETKDELGVVASHQLYQYSIGFLASGDAVLSFVYTQHVFACNLSQPSISEYIAGFNSLNCFMLNSRFPTGIGS